MDIRVVAVLSTYREGHLGHEAIQSALDSDLDHVLVAEGPAGGKSPGAPKTLIPDSSALEVIRGEWDSDAQKRTAMLHAIKRRYPRGPVWGVFVDGDELLVHGRHLRAALQAAQWNDEQRHRIRPSDNPTLGWGLLQVEPDGAITEVAHRCLRFDLLQSYQLSNLILDFGPLGQQRPGNRPFSASQWVQPHLAAYNSRDQMWSITRPLSCEPHTVHRPHLRHPSRQGLRGHELEAVKLALVDSESE